MNQVLKTSCTLLSSVTYTIRGLATIFTAFIAPAIGSFAESNTDTNNNYEINSSELPSNYLDNLSLSISPQTTSMILYDNLSSLQNSGRLDLSIPLIHFSDPDFDFPICIRYNSGGLKPNEPDNFVGRDWSLECGGLIYREVKGKPDDMLADPTTAGFLWNVQHPKLDPETLKKNLLSGSPLSYIGTFLTEDALAFKDNNYQGEFSSDIYHFSFGGHSGKFMIDFDGSVIVSGNDGRHYTVDISRYRLRTETRGYYAEIRIGTDDGYTYCFGGSYGATDYNAIEWETSPSTDWMNNKISGFYLSKIIAPNGREMNISYLGEEIEQEYHDRPGLLDLDSRYDDILTKGYNKYYSFSVSPTVSRGLEWFAVDGIIDTDSSFPFYLVDENIQTLHKVALISKIETDDKIITFSYSGRKPVKYLENGISRFGSTCGAKLQSVSMRSTLGSAVIERSSLQYEYHNEAFMLLKSVTNTIEGTYSFDYNYSDVRPCTKNIDHWGFFRNSSAYNKSLLPLIDEGKNHDPNSNNDFEYKNDARDPALSDYDALLLKKIVYPTGGSTEIIYEQNDYSSHFVKNTANGFRKKLVDENINYPCGGARIQQLKFFDEKGDLAKHTAYKYTISPDDNRSSGILSYIPQYYHIWRTHGVSNDIYAVLSSSTGFNVHDLSGPHISYSSVTEYIVNSAIEHSCPKNPDAISIPFGNIDDAIRTQDVSIGKPDARFPGKEIEEIKLARWHIKINTSPHSDCTDYGYIKVSQKGKGVILEEKIYGDNETYKKYEKTIRPGIDFGKGDYTVEIGKIGDINVFFQQFTPYSSSMKIQGASIVTKYTDYHTNPDTYADDSRIFWGKPYYLYSSALPNKALDEVYLKYNFLDSEDRSVERGKIVSQVWLDHDSDTVKMIEYNYQRFGEDRFGIYASEQPVVSNAITASLFSCINKEYFYSYKPTRKTTTLFDKATSTRHEKMEYYKYNNEGYLTEHTQVTGVYDQKVKSFIYCGDCGEDGVDDKFHGLIKETRERNKGLSSPNNEKRTLYSYNSSGKISSIETYSSSTMTGYKRFSCFDQYGNPTEATTSSGKTYTYVWGYFGKYPVAIIENSTAVDVEAFLGVAPCDISRSGESYLQQLDQFRQENPKFLVYTYEWSPMIGVIKSTDPSGMSRSYTYDSTNRLITERLLLKDGTMEVLKSYIYNIVNR